MPSKFGYFFPFLSPVIFLATISNVIEIGDGNLQKSFKCITEIFLTPFKCCQSNKFFKNKKCTITPYFSLKSAVLSQKKVIIYNYVLLLFIYILPKIGYNKVNTYWMAQLHAVIIYVLLYI